MSTARRRDHERGSVALMTAVSMVMIIGMAALAMDAGRAYHARTQLQAGLDAAALAGARSLDGTTGGITAARAAVVDFGAQNRWSYASGGVAVTTSQITFGHWDLTARTFTELTPSSSNVTSINAVKVNRTDSGARELIATTFGRFFGKTSVSVGASAIAVGGGIGQACGFPVAIADCALQAAPNCGSTTSITLNSATTDNAAWTVFSSSPPVSASAVGTALADGTCGSRGEGVVGTNIAVNNGNQHANLQYIADNLLNVVVKAPVITSGQPVGACGNIGFSASTTFPLQGFIHARVTAVRLTGPNQGFDLQIVCDQPDTDDRAGGVIGGPNGEPFVAQ